MNVPEAFPIRRLCFPDSSIGRITLVDDTSIVTEFNACGEVSVRWDQLVYLRVHSQSLSELQHIPGNEVWSLSAEGTNIIRDADLSSIEHLVSLHELNLNDQLLTDAGVDILAKLPGLQRLNLAGNAIGDNSLVKLVAGGRLLEVDISRTAVSDAGVEMLIGSSLQKLNLSGTMISDRALEFFALMPWLRSLGLAGTKVTDEGIARLHFCDILDELDLSDTIVGNGALSLLSRFNYWKSLKLENTQVPFERLHSVCSAMGKQYYMPSMGSIALKTVEQLKELPQFVIRRADQDERTQQAAEETVNYPAAKEDSRSYISLIGMLARPTDEQFENFAQFVSNAHSWYKKLPLLTGWSFVVFLNPVAGAGHETSERLHYSWKTTKEYREKFGFLDYRPLEEGRSAASFSIAGREVVLPCEITERCSFVMFPYVQDHAVRFHDKDFDRILHGLEHPQSDRLLAWRKAERDLTRCGVMTMAEEERLGQSELPKDHPLRRKYERYRSQKKAISQQLHSIESAKIRAALKNLKTWLCR